jgi:hypothetical protein
MAPRERADDRLERRADQEHAGDHRAGRSNRRQLQRQQDVQHAHEKRRAADQPRSPRDERVPHRRDQAAWLA